MRLQEMARYQTPNFGRRARPYHARGDARRRKQASRCGVPASQPSAASLRRTRHPDHDRVGHHVTARLGRQEQHPCSAGGAAREHGPRLPALVCAPTLLLAQGHRRVARDPRHGTAAGRDPRRGGGCNGVEGAGRRRQDRSALRAGWADAVLGLAGGGHDGQPSLGVARGPAESRDRRAPVGCAVRALLRREAYADPPDQARP